MIKLLMMLAVIVVLVVIGFVYVGISYIKLSNNYRTLYIGKFVIRFAIRKSIENVVSSTMQSLFVGNIIKLGIIKLYVSYDSSIINNIPLVNTAKLSIYLGNVYNCRVTTKYRNGKKSYAVNGISYKLKSNYMARVVIYIKDDTIVTNLTNINKAYNNRCSIESFVVSRSK